MNWVTIDQDLCNACGMCARRCPRCYTNNDGVISVQADEECCNLCGHCVALCKPSAITHSRLDMSNFPPVGPSCRAGGGRIHPPGPAKEKLPVLQEKAIPREDIEKLVAMSRYCPTGSNMQTVQIKIVTNREKIKKLSDLTVEFFLDMIDQVDQKIAELTAGGKNIPGELAERKLFVDRYRRMGQARDLGIDPILHSAPLVMLFHSPPNPSTPKDDCVIAAQTVVLGAMTLGLGSCYIGLLTKAASDYPPLQEVLDLPSGHTVYSVLVLGYPKLKFQKVVDRKPLAVQWEE